jgi:hypothetical protein
MKAIRENDSLSRRTSAQKMQQAIDGHAARSAPR